MEAYDKECLYCETWKTDDANCSYYISSRSIKQYIPCKEELCPIKHPELVKGGGFCE